MTIRSLFILATFATVIACVSDIEACSCVTIGDALTASRTQEALFRGRVVTAVMVLVGKDGGLIYKDGPEPLDGFVQRIVVFRVEELFKGSLPPIVTLITGSGAGDCGYVFEADKDYVVFANTTTERPKALLAGASRAWTSSICSFTQPAEKAVDLLAALRKAYPAREPVWVVWPPSVP
jgi:hypothetical protein